MGRIRARHPAALHGTGAACRADQFRVIPGRAALHTQASTTNNPLLSELAPTNTLWIHTEAAQALALPVATGLKCVQPQAPLAVYALR